MGERNFWGLPCFSRIAFSGNHGCKAARQVNKQTNKHWGNNHQQLNLTMQKSDILH